MNPFSIPDAQRVAYGYLAHMILLLMVYAPALLLQGVKLFAPDPLAHVLPYHQAALLEQTALALAIKSLLIGGGLYLVATLLPDARLKQPGFLWFAYRLWSVVCLLSVIGGLSDVLQTGNDLSLTRVLDVAVILVIGLTLISVVMSLPTWTSLSGVWILTMSGLLFSDVVELIPSTMLKEDILFHALSAGLRERIVYPIGITGLLFWLMARFSHVPVLWAKRGLYSVTGLQAVAGALLILPTFYGLFASPFFAFAGGIALCIIPIVYIIFAAHSYRAFSDRKDNPTLAAHWAALGVIAILIGAGIIGAINAVPAVATWTVGTRWTDVASFLVMGGSIAVGLGVVNQVGDELRGQGGRITGFVPFWLIAFGLLGGGFALALIGTAQIYLARVIGIAYLESEALIAPLYLLWVICLLAYSLGIGIYALGFWIRRPQMGSIPVVVPPPNEFAMQATPEGVLF